MTTFTPRPKQQEVLNYRHGRMGVSAVPGAGKTRTLSALAAQIIIEGDLQDDQEVLIVTLVNSAVENFARQIGGFIRARGLLPNVGYRVRTLHGLCSDIVRDRPSLVNLPEGFAILDDREAERIRRDAAQALIEANAHLLDDFLAPDLKPERVDFLRQRDIPDQVARIGTAFIQQAKDNRQSPNDIRRMLDSYLDEMGQPLILAEIGSAIYRRYEDSLAQLAAVDFQDLIRFAHDILVKDPDYLARLRYRFPYVLEDEAQDSSQLQEAILRMLTGENGNWVRVGDPNQAIYETFTTARPENLRRFIREPGVTRRELPNSGRSAPKILDLANQLIHWSRDRHPNPDVRARVPLDEPFILPTPPGDPQPNPADETAIVNLYPQGLTSDEEINTVVRSAAKWIAEHPDETCAILSPTNKHGYRFIDALQTHDVPHVELLQSTTATRETAGALTLVMKYLIAPDNPDLLAKAFEVWRRDDRDSDEGAARLKRIIAALRQCDQVESYVQPQLGKDWLNEEPARTLIAEDALAGDYLEGFRPLIRKWQAAVLLPVDQLLLLLAQDLFTEPVDLAVAHSIALVLRGYSDAHHDWRLPNFADELQIIAKNERKFLGMDDDARGFDPDAHKGKVTVTTVHSAKGLEWDRVYLTSVNNYDYPAGLPGDSFISERWWVRDDLNLEAEALAQLSPDSYRTGEASRAARLDYIAERVRLLYVGITRARRELIVTWNTGQRGDRTAAAAFTALRTYLEQQNGAG